MDVGGAGGVGAGVVGILTDEIAAGWGGGGGGIDGFAGVVSTAGDETELTESDCV